MKKKINKSQLIGLILWGILIFLCINDIVNVMKIPPEEWNNQVLFVAQFTGAFLIYSIIKISKIKIMTKKRDREENREKWLLRRKNKRCKKKKKLKVWMG